MIVINECWHRISECFPMIQGVLMFVLWVMNHVSKKVSFGAILASISTGMIVGIVELNSQKISFSSRKATMETSHDRNPVFLWLIVCLGNATSKHTITINSWHGQVQVHQERRTKSRICLHHVWLTRQWTSDELCFLAESPLGLAVKLTNQFIPGKIFTPPYVPCEGVSVNFARNSLIVHSSWQWPWPQPWS